MSAASDAPPWMAHLPHGWIARRLKLVASVALSNVDKKSEPNEPPVRLCNYTDVYHHDFITADMPFMEATATPAQIRRFQLQRDDVIITKDSEEWNDIAVPACVADDLQDVVCGYHLAVLRSRPTVMAGRFLFRALQASGVREQFFVAATGITRYGLSRDGITDAFVPVPPVNLQRRIASFLDRETAALDALIDKKERLVELLHGKRQALISQAVTRGLDPSVSMKESGVEWLGQIPANWKVIALKRTARPGARTFTDGDWIETPFITEEGVRLIQTGNVGIGVYREKGYRYVSEETFHALGCTQVDPGDVLICRLDGPVGRACLAPDLGCRMITSVDNAILKPSADHDARFLVYFMSSAPWINWIQAICRVGGGFRLRVSRTMLGDLHVAVPPRAEQSRIADALDSLVRATRELEGKILRHVELLREYRQALITAAVTGKLDLSKEAC